MKKLSKRIVRWIPSGIKFFDSDGKLNSLGKWEYDDGSLSKETAKNEVDSRVIGSQNPEAYKVAHLTVGGQLHTDVYANSRKRDGSPRYNVSIHGTKGLRAGTYVYFSDGVDVWREVYDLSGNNYRDPGTEHCGYWDKGGYFHFDAMVEHPADSETGLERDRFTRSDTGKTHDTFGIVTKASEVLSENKRTR